MNGDKSHRPIGPFEKRPLHLIFLCDCSGSMKDKGKIQSLNNAIREALPHIKDAADENRDRARVEVQAIGFSDGAQWCSPASVALEDFRWADLKADGVTDMGKAFTMVADQLKVQNMPQRGLSPVLILISDGQPTDDYRGGLSALMAQPWGQHSVRLAIAIGPDADHACLREFIGNPEIPVLQADNPEKLAERIKWASTTAIRHVSAPKPQHTEAGQPTGAPLPQVLDAADGGDPVF